MFWWLKELFSSLRFIAIQSGESLWRSKRVYEFLLPSAVTILFAVTFFFAPGLFIKGFAQAIAQQTFQFMVFVVPFHLAALGAFATFQRPVLDEPLKGGTAELRVWSNADQQYEWMTLTLRQYASLLFGYLCSIGLIFICAFIVLNVIDYGSFATHWQKAAQSAGGVCLVFFVAHYALLSVYAITFLFEKVNGISRAR